MEGPDAPAAQQSPRVPVTTRPEVPRKQRKEKNKRLYGAKRTASGNQLQRAPEKKFAVVSPDTIVQFNKAIDIFTYGVDANMGRPADRDVVEADRALAAAGVGSDRRRLWALRVHCWQYLGPNCIMVS